MIDFKYNDGGRAEAGYPGRKKGDCCCRAIAIATQRPYTEIHALIDYMAKRERITKRTRQRSNAETGVYTKTAQRIFDLLKWEWVPLMGIGTGCQAHLDANELPKGRIVCNVSRHYTAVIDGVINDTYDCSRNGNRCVYGYWKPTENALKPTDPLPVTLDALQTPQNRTTRKVKASTPHSKKRAQNAPRPPKTPRQKYDKHGYLQFDERSMRHAIESLIPPEFRPYYTGCEIEKYYEGVLTADNSDIYIYFKAPVCGPIGDTRYIHCSLLDLPQEIDACFMGDGLDEDEYYADYDEEYGTRRVVDIKTPYISDPRERRALIATWRMSTANKCSAA